MEVIRYIHKWTKPSTNLQFFTFPMIHIGDGSFYNEVRNLVSDLHSVLVEGVSLNTRELGSYRKLAKGLGLQTQASLDLPTDLPKHNIDIDPSVFKKEMQRLPISEKLDIKKLDFALTKNWAKRKEVILELLIKQLSYHETCKHILIDPEKHVALKHKNKSRTRLLFENTRNDCFQRKLNLYIDENIDRPFAFNAGILLGDAHMPFIYEVLKERGFRWSLYREVVVINFQTSSLKNS